MNGNKPKFDVTLEHGERIPLGSLEEFMTKVYDTINKAQIQYRLDQRTAQRRAVNAD